MANTIVLPPNTAPQTIQGLLPAGAASAVKQDAGLAALASILSALQGTLAVDASALLAGTITTTDTSYATHASAYAQVTVTTTAQTLAQLLGAAVPAWATMAFVKAATGSLHQRADGTAPTATVGYPITAGVDFPLQGAATLAAVQIISGTGSNITVDIEFRG